MDVAVKRGHWVGYGNMADLMAHSQTSDSESLVHGSPAPESPEMHVAKTLLSLTPNLPKQNLWAKALESTFYPTGHVTLL